MSLDAIGIISGQMKESVQFYGLLTSMLMAQKEKIPLRNGLNLQQVL